MISAVAVMSREDKTAQLFRTLLALPSVVLATIVGHLILETFEAIRT
jgi:hypothetical protein